MVKCPGCGAILPDGAVTCQFCGKTVGGPPPIRLGRPASSRTPAVSPGAPRWAGTAYNLIAVYWILSGAYSVLTALLLADKGAGVVAAAFGLFPVAVGLGLILRIEFVRGIVNVLCGLQILFGIVGVLGSFFAGHPLGVLMSFFQIATAGFMIYLIGETETRPPNF